MHTAVITGATGSIGRNLVRKLREENVRIICIARKTSDTSYLETMGAEIVRCDPDDIPMLGNIDCFYNLAWEGASGNAREDEILQQKNVILSESYARAAIRTGTKRFVGTGTVIELKKGDNMPSEPYRRAKIQAFESTKQICKGTSHIWAYLPSTYGVGIRSGFVYNTLKKFLDNEDTSFTSGTNLFDFININDVVNGLYLIGSGTKQNEQYYIGSNAPKKLREFIIEMKDAVNPDIEPGFGIIDLRDGELTIEQLSCKKLMDDTGYVPSVRFEDGIKEILNWLKKD